MILHLFSDGFLGGSPPPSVRRAFASPWLATGSTWHWYQCLWPQWWDPSSFTESEWSIDLEIWYTLPETNCQSTWKWTLWKGKSSSKPSFLASMLILLKMAVWKRYLQWTMAFFLNLYVEFQRDISIIHVDVFLRTYAGHLNVCMYIMYFLAAVNPTKPIRCILQHISVGYPSEVLYTVMSPKIVHFKIWCTCPLNLWMLRFNLIAWTVKSTTSMPFTRKLYHLHLWISPIQPHMWSR